MLHIMRHLIGSDLAKPLTKGSIKECMDFMLVEMLHIEGNAAVLQMDALEVIANAMEKKSPPSLI